VSSELKRLQTIADALPVKLPKEDHRLKHIGVYMLCNKADPLVLNIIVLEQFACLSILDQSPK
jgi:hypothetical protein